MFRIASLAATAFCLLGAAPASAQISGTIGGDFVEVLDRKQFLISGSPVAHDLALLRAPDGSLALAEACAGAPVRVAALGLTMPGSSTWGNIVVHPGDVNGADHTLVAIVFDAEIWLVDLGALTRPGPLDPVFLDSI